MTTLAVESRSLGSHSHYSDGSRCSHAWRAMYRKALHHGSVLRRHALTIRIRVRVRGNGRGRGRLGPQEAHASNHMKCANPNSYMKCSNPNSYMKCANPNSYMKCANPNSYMKCSNPEHNSNCSYCEDVLLSIIDAIMNFCLLLLSIMDDVLVDVRIDV